MQGVALRQAPMRCGQERSCVSISSSCSSSSSSSYGTGVTVGGVVWLTVRVFLAACCALHWSEVLQVQGPDEKASCFALSSLLYALGFAADGHYALYAQCVRATNMLLVPLEYARNWLHLIGKATIFALAVAKSFQSIAWAPSCGRRSACPR